MALSVIRAGFESRHLDPYTQSVDGVTMCGWVFTGHSCLKLAWCLMVACRAFGRELEGIMIAGKVIFLQT